MNRPFVRVALVPILVLVAGACGSNEPSASTSATAPASTTAGPSVSVAASTLESSPATSTETVATPSAAACTKDALLPTVADLFPDNPRWHILDIQIAECRGGYVRLFAVADQSTCSTDVPQCLENEQVFLQDVSGAWTYLDSGTGLSCQDTQFMSPPIVPACAVLGAS